MTSDRVRAVQDLRRSNAATPHGGTYNRSAERTAAIQDQEESVTDEYRCPVDGGEVLVDQETEDAECGNSGCNWAGWVGDIDGSDLEDEDY